MPKLRCWAIMAALVSPVISIATAQQSSASTPSALPVPLVNALFNSRGSLWGIRPEYFVGALPSWFPAALVPPAPARIVGSMLVGNEIVAVFSSADSTRRLAADFEQIFVRAGFVRPKPAPGSGFSPGYGSSTSFCSDSASVSAQEVGEDRNLAQVTFRGDMGAGCRSFTPPPRAVAERLSLPELKPPSSVQVLGSSGG